MRSQFHQTVNSVKLHTERALALLAELGSFLGLVLGTRDFAS